MSKNVTVKILHNTHPNKTYANGDPMEQVLTFDSPFPACGHVKMLLQIVFRQLNIDDPSIDWAWRYRAQGHRSLTVGDVVIINEKAWTVDPRGWREVIVHEHQIDGTESPAPSARGRFRLGERIS